MTNRFATNKHNPEPSIDAATDDQLLVPSELYHENSKYRMSDAAPFLRVNHINNSSDIRRIISRPFPQYRGFPKIALPRDFPRRSISTEDVLERRCSRRRFSGEAISLSTLAKLLYFGDGIVRIVDNDDGSQWHLRTAPSGGALFPIETYLIPLNVSDLVSGVHFYDPAKHALVELRRGDFLHDLKAGLLLEDVAKAAACLILVATMPRCKFKYGERAYRFALLEAGHIAQNLLLVAECEGLASYPIGGFIDDRLHELLNLDGCEQIVIYVVLVGHHRRKAADMQVREETGVERALE
jgi:SagB-type dehydrogenase family enzyme